MIDIFLLDGIGGHGGPSAMAQNVARPLVESGRYRSFDTTYAASIGPVNPQNNPFNTVWLRKSDIDGANRAAVAIRATPNLAAIIGYSGGASATSQLLEDMARGASYTRGLEIVWAVTIANPRRRRSPDAPGYGIVGEHTDYPPFVQHFEVANADDGICCCPAYSPLRTLADAGQDGPDPIAWLRMVQRNAWQTTIPTLPAKFSDPMFWLRPDATQQLQTYHWLVAEAIATKDGWLTASRYLRGYLDGTAHGTDYWEKRLFDPVVRELLARRWE